MTKLLIADDSPHKTMLMQGMLFKAGWKGEILEATTTEAAIGMIDAHPDILFALVDFYIPSSNGPFVIEYLKKNRPGARAALVSSSDKYENLEEAKAAGAEACICTSYEADEVERMFTDLLKEWMGNQ